MTRRTLAVLLTAFAWPTSGQGTGPGVPEFGVREGYLVEVAVPSLPGARFLAFDDRGTLYVSLPGPGVIRTFHDPDGDGRYEPLGTFVQGKRSVHGLCFADGWMWFSTESSIHKGRDTNGDGVADEVVDVLSERDLPTRGGHWWRSLLVTGDHIYTSIGDSGNITDERDTDRQKLWRYHLDGTGKTLFAEGLRNTEKLRIRPGDDPAAERLWGFDHGSDWFGQPIGDRQGHQPITDLNPPDELNLYVRGGFYGHPFVTGLRVPRYEYLDRSDIHDLAARTTPPEWCVGAHWATNGFTFVDPARNRGAFPPDHNGDIFIACHGSWNSSVPVGYCVARVIFDDDPLGAGRPVGMVKVVSTLSRDARQVLARPADVEQAPDGSLFFSTSGREGAIYRLRYVGMDE